jgi:DNA-binding SARP family transcriptional activator
MTALTHLAGEAVALQLAGAPLLRLGDRRIELAASDGLLLAWLALQGATARDRMAQLLWPDSDAAAARNALRQRLFRLRRLCGRDLVSGTQLLVLAKGLQHDLGAATPLLEGLQASAGSELEHWLQAEREARRQRERAELAARIEALEAAADYGGALPLALELLRAEPLSEDAHRRVMRLHYLRGDRAAALLAFDHCAALLKDEIGAAPSVQTLALLRTLQSGDAETAAAPAHPKSRTLPAALLRPPRLIGRNAELQALREGWLAGTPVLVVGEAGIGKSRLLQTLAAQDASLASAAGRPGDSLVPYATLARLLAVLMERLGPAVEPRTRRGLAPLLPMLGEPGTAPRGGSLLPAVQALLLQAATLVGGLVLDDLHFADSASLELLRSLLAAPRGDGTSLRWCLGLRPAPADTPLAALVEAVGSAGPCTRVLVQPLAVPQIAELVRSLQLPGLEQASERWAPVLRQRSGGNPLFALETLKLAWSQGLLAPSAAATHSDELPRSASLQQLIEQQLARLTPQALALARLAAVAGVDFSLLLAEGVLARSALDLADPWHELEQQQVLVGSEFAHDLVHEAVLAGVPSLIARRLHAQVALWLEGRAAAAELAPDPARLAAHWERAGEPVRALPHLRAAAERAHVALREHERIEFLLRAADIAEQRSDRAAAFAAVAAAVQSHMNTIRHAGGYSLLDRLDALAANDAERALALGHRAWYCVQLADSAGALRHGAAALTLAETLADPLPGLVIRHRLATALAATGHFDEALAHFELAATQIAELQRQASTAPLPDADLAEYHGNHAAMLDNLGRAAEAATQRRLALAAAVRAGDAAQQVSQLANQAVSLHSAGSYAEMLDIVEQAQRLVARYEMDGSTVGFVAVLKCQGERALGRFAAALAAADQAEQVLAASNPARLPVVHLQRGHCWLDLGQTARAQQSLAAAGEALPPHLQARRCLLLARALPREAAAWRERAAAALPAQGWPEIALLVRLEATRGLAAVPALASIATLRDEATRLGLHGVRRAALVRLFERLLGDARGGVGEAALTSALDDAAALQGEALPGNGVAAALAYVAELPWLAARLLHQHGRSDEARALHERLRRWLEDNAARQVGEPFRAGHLERNPVNRAVLAGLPRADGAGRPIA